MNRAQRKTTRARRSNAPALNSPRPPLPSATQPIAAPSTPLRNTTLPDSTPPPSIPSPSSQAIVEATCALALDPSSLASARTEESPPAAKRVCVPSPRSSPPDASMGDEAAGDAGLLAISARSGSPFPVANDSPVAVVPDASQVVDGDDGMATTALGIAAAIHPEGIGLATRVMASLASVDPVSTEAAATLTPQEHDRLLMAQTRRAKIANLRGSTQQSYSTWENRFLNWAKLRYHKEAVPELVTEDKMHAFLCAARGKELPEQQSAKRKADDADDKPPAFNTISKAASAVSSLWRKQEELGHKMPNPRGQSVIEFFENYGRDGAKRRKDTNAVKHNVFAQGYNAIQLVKLCAAYRKVANPSEGLRALCAQLVSHNCLLRSDNMRAAELSDLSVHAMGDIDDPHKGVFLVVRLGQTKVRGPEDSAQYVGTLRHRNPLRCPIFATALYFFWRFHIMMEPFPNFADRGSWYQRKLLAGAKLNEPMRYDDHNDAVSSAFRDIEWTAYKKTTHAARGSGAQEMENRGVSEDSIARMGKWGSQLSSSLEHAYLLKVPQSAMRGIAGFHPDGRDYFLERACVPPPQTLLEAIFPQADIWGQSPWAESTRENLTSIEGDGGTYQMCEVFKWLRIVLLQDIYALQEDCPNHPLLAHELFQRPTFHQWQREHKEARNSCVKPNIEAIRRWVPAFTDVITTAAQDIKGDVAREGLKIERGQAVIRAENKDDHTRIETVVRRVEDRQLRVEKSQDDISSDLKYLIELLLNRPMAAEEALQAAAAKLTHQGRSDFAVIRQRWDGRVLHGAVPRRVVIDPTPASAPPAEALDAPGTVEDSAPSAQGRREGEGETVVIARAGSAPVAPSTTEEAAARPSRSVSAPAPVIRYYINRDITTLREAWQEWDEGLRIGTTHGPALRDLEAEYGTSWNGGNNHNERRQFNRRMEVLRFIERVKPEHRAAELDRLQAFMAPTAERKALTLGTVVKALKAGEFAPPPDEWLKDGKL